MSPDEQLANELAHEERRTDPEARQQFTQVVATHLSRAGQKGGQVHSIPKKRAAKDNCAKARQAKAFYRANPGLKPKGWAGE